MGAATDVAPLKGATVTLILSAPASAISESTLDHLARVKLPRGVSAERAVAVLVLVEARWVTGQEIPSSPALRAAVEVVSEALRDTRGGRVRTAVSRACARA